MKKHLSRALPILVLLFLAGCSGGPNPESESGASAPVAPSKPVSMNKNDYPVFPDADAGADPSVPADQGGRGFTGKGWQTNTDFNLIGDPRAVKGGILRDHLTDFPGTLRLEGPESNTGFNYGVTALAYESLLSIDPTTLKYIPSLATHWQVSPDKMTFRFRINPNARFSDGTPVTSADVIATYDFMMDKTLQSPSSQLTYGKLDRPVAESKYIVRVHAKKLNWRNFLYFSGMPILPAHVLKTINGAKYIKEYNYRLLPGTGPYTIHEEDIKKGKSITVVRRKDYWGEKARANIGLNNFDKLQFVVVRDPNLAFEMFKKGELDVYTPSTARQWVKDFNFDNVRRGLIQKRKIFNNAPEGFQGFAMNTRRTPFNDIRVRKAMALLLNRRLLIEKIMLNQDLPLNSYYAGTPYQNPNNPTNQYNPQEALKLLAGAGWSSHDAQGRLVKNGRPLQIELMYATPTVAPQLTIYQNALRKVGIALNLRFITPEQQFQLISERRFQMAYTGWGALLFPNPETQWMSSLADINNTNNITGFKSARVDAICREYDRMFNMTDRIRANREIDGILAKSYQYVLTWYAPYTRVAYWNKFGMPPGSITRTGDYSTIYQLWWIDPAKDAKLRQAFRDSSLKLAVKPEEDHYWTDFDKKEQAKQQSGKAL